MNYYELLYDNKFSNLLENNNGGQHYSDIKTRKSQLKERKLQTSQCPHKYSFRRS